ncbi:MAG: PTS sugar transporter subunit IIA [Gammaproteobacteria bacterium]|nr:PTS sugar transporter subunit IIA [Gammaproteobacteria bacterium]MCW8983417.1 PTS sugar transporter subunit IIA [Gammaproteobacteria bacterium]
MSVSFIILTHHDIGQQMVNVVEETLATKCPSMIALSVYPDQSIEQLIGQVELQRVAFDEGDGLIIFTDLYGATPGNVACSLLEIPSVKVITGVNLPMLLKAQSYADLPLDELVDKIIEGGREAIILCNKDICQIS